MVVCLDCRLGLFKRQSRETGGGRRRGGRLERDGRETGCPAASVCRNRRTYRAVGGVQDGWECVTACYIQGLSISKPVPHFSPVCFFNQSCTFESYLLVKAPLFWLGVKPKASQTDLPLMTVYRKTSTPAFGLLEDTLVVFLHTAPKNSLHLRENKGRAR